MDGLLTLQTRQGMSVAFVERMACSAGGWRSALVVLVQQLDPRMQSAKERWPLSASARPPWVPRLRKQIVSAVHLILREFSQCDDEFLR